MQRPRAAALFTDGQRNSAATGATETEGDVLEIPFVTALLIVNDQVTVFQTDFIEVLPIEAGQAQAVEPIKAGKQSGLRGVGACRRRGGLGW